MKSVKVVVAAIIVLAACVGLAYKFFAPGQNVSVTKSWTQSDESNLTQIDHSKWQDVLDNYLVSDDKSGINLFDYQGMVDDEDETLSEYIDELSQLDPRLFNRNEQFAYWINLYNALTVLTVVESYPVNSIKEIGEAAFPLGPWNDDVVEVAGKSLTLNHIEHSILRPIWNDYRIHFAVNCASIGCPNLQAQAFDAANTEALLNAAATQFINHSRGVSLAGEGLVLSSIFSWYAEDFGSTEKEVLTTIAKYLDGEAAQVDLTDKKPISYDYDWSLNDWSLNSLD